MNPLPQYLYYIKIIPGGPRLRYGEKGGGVYSREDYARDQLDRLRRQGVRCDLYESPIDWFVIDAQPQLEGQEGLF